MLRLSPTLLVLLAAPAFAQGPAGAAPPSPVEREASRAPQVSDSEKVKRSQQSVGRMREVLKNVLSKLEEARNSKDVVKLSCVNEKLTQVKGLLRISEQADVALQEAIAKREQGTAEHEFAKVMIARGKVDQMRAEAEECIGQLAFRTDENMLVEVEEPEGLPDDPTRPKALPAVAVRPPPASPTR